MLDEQSKSIFRQRLLYTLTGDWQYIREWLASYSIEGKGYYDIFDVYRTPDKWRHTKNVLFGVGLWNNVLREVFRHCNLPYDFFCDNDMKKVGKMFQGKKIISAGQLEEMKLDAVVFIATLDYQREVLRQLRDMGFADERIVRIPSYHEMYIDADIMTPKAEEVLIDCGCLDGESSIAFSKWCKGKGKIYAFEPDQQNIQKCRHNMERDCGMDWRLIEKGAWSEDAVLSFRENNSGTSAICENGEQEIQVTSIDRVVAREDRVTFIKMDIEGAELEALKGASETIKRNKPRLAISLYHKPEDTVEIPLYIKSLVPEYKFYLRSYVPLDIETVLYAVCEEG